MSSKRFFLFDPVFLNLGKKRYLFFFKNAYRMKHFKRFKFCFNYDFSRSFLF